MSFFKPKFTLERFIKKARKFDSFELQKYEQLVAHLKENGRQVEQRNLGLKMIVISDTHGDIAFHEDDFECFVRNIKEYDLCLLLGDLHPRDLEIILQYIPKHKMAAIKGNHDSFELYKRVGIREFSGRTVSCKGVTIAGIEGSFKYKKERYPLFTQYESLVLAQSIPAADVVVTHDKAFETSIGNMAHIGLVGTTYLIYRDAVLWHIHGHLHKSYQKVMENGTVEKSVYQYEYIEI